MNVATITFHRAQNFGSALQAYALQQFVIRCGNDCSTPVNYQIIDLSSESQKNLYKIFKPSLRPKDFIKNIVNLIYVKSLKTRERKFESFLNNELRLSHNYLTKTETSLGLHEVDCFISGSDQIWNVRAKDFADFYYLDFISGVRKISYAASFGPLAIDWTQYDKEKYARLLSDYTAVSVREQGSADNILQLTGKGCEIHVDPTLLLDVAEWRKIQSNANYNNGKYILLYCLEPTPSQLKMVQAISEKFNLPVVALRYNNKHDMFNNFIKRYDAGPKDFLAYIDHAAMVVTSSFHGTAFSIIYRKPFCALNGMSDNRISNILTESRLTSHAIKGLDDLDSVTMNLPDSIGIENFLTRERQRSSSYLKQVLPL